MKLIDLVQSYAMTEYANTPLHQINVYFKSKKEEGKKIYLLNEMIPPNKWVKYINDHPSLFADREVIKWDFGSHTRDHTGRLVEAWTLWVEVERHDTEKIS